ncbi:MAG: phosphoadenylyl-sulfate reductase [Hoeflea sp.]|uniref:phosphoadenylyl-sulfate reductase n=1 Tax=Hoeflea sp. TaxID=1940281 RepID=UPI001E0EE6FB|nr:phosphoadenylyl-sulfate reductase [Hoeflea sp.]MBU4527883.1 phosphoadenylyl-sulfate reductase [Alphaproteobacteria bacterium]MBU4546082.1 phosphoadenylyl-sulfate reductase [Alphaproteobacteria bacterium]MBU4553233.1 phosphoadenylyl-sulfate reductase [Alphaproteobacteria bacterium]MBV1724305.1 phosphoadenylyl-sulfate reductase [Hoeflea sp.]MBV1759990.1 phosphoadenylyl-sulfate reductase [Hoeflea sp.]
MTLHQPLPRPGVTPRRDFGPALAAELAQELAPLSLPGRILRIAALGRAVFTTSLGLEDQVLTSLIAATSADVRIVTLDTGRLFAETLTLMAETEARYRLSIEVFKPWKEEVDGFVALYGMNGFYDSVEARHACCHARKLQPLGRALADAEIWVTGLRRGQSGNRANAPLAEWDADRSLIKINPLADQSLETLRARANADDVPVNPLHAKGYPSIGCEPCTRAIKPGEPERAGRWWWEQDERRECGLHLSASVSGSRAQGQPKVTTLASATSNI